MANLTGLLFKPSARQVPRAALEVSIAAGSRQSMRRWASVIGTILVFLAIVLFVRQVPWHSIRAAFLAANGRWLGVAVMLNFLLIVLRGVALRYLIYPAAWVPLARSIRYTLASITGNIIAPLRAGIALRAWLLMRYERLSLSSNVALFLVEKVGDMATLLALAATLPWLLPTFPRWALGSVAFLGALVIAALGLAMSTKTKASLGQNIRRTVAPIARADTLCAAAAATIGVWAVDALMVVATLKAVGVPCTPGIAILILLAINIAITVPTPANGGTLELGAVLALHTVGVEPGKAIAFAVLYHAAQVLPTLAVGIWDGPLLWQSPHPWKVRQPACEVDAHSSLGPTR
jgi:uncharacterized membrane protein YbhN (UPF0104 family)